MHVRIVMIVVPGKVTGLPTGNTVQTPTMCIKLSQGTPQKKVSITGPMPPRRTLPGLRVQVRLLGLVGQTAGLEGQEELK